MSIWNERYNTSEYLFGLEPNDYLRNQAFRLAPSSRILCIGEGEGRNAVFLASLGHQVTALDASQVGLVKAQNLALSKNLSLEILHMDLTHFAPEPESYDAVVSIFCHLPSSLRQVVHRKVLQALKPGGLFLLEAYTAEQLKFGTGGPSNPDLLYSLALLHQDLDPSQFLDARECERTLQEGTAHRGPSAVVQIVVQK